MYYQDILQRELLLKCGGSDIPRPKSVVLTISLSDTRLGQQMASKSDLLLYKLALEHVAGRPAEFLAPPNKHHNTDKADGVQVTLVGGEMFSFLEKLVYSILPNQIGFEGVSLPAVDRTSLESKKSRMLLHVSEFKVTNMLLYPDFEQNFDLFEPLRSMHVKVVVENASSPAAAQLLLCGLGLPVMSQVGA